jgi:tetratricopeptide (TPR) repeat protein
VEILRRRRSSVEIPGGVRYGPAVGFVLRSGVCALGACAAGLLAAGEVRADPVPPALTREFQAGVDAYRLGKYDDARAHLEKAEALDPRLPGPHRFLAAVAQAQRRWADCIAEARRALQLNPQSHELADTRRLHDSCRESDGRPAYRGELGDAAAIAITANVSGATVRIGGLRYGGTPVAPRLIKPGTLRVDVEKSGWKPAHVTVDALPAIITDIAVELEPLAPAARPAAP